MFRFNELTLAGAIERGAAQTPDLAVLTLDGGGVRADDVRTYSTLWDHATRIATSLQANGLGRGDVVALLMANHVEFIEIMTACCLVGATFVAIDPRTKGDRLSYMLRTAGARAVVAADYAYGSIQEIQHGLPELQCVVVLETDEAPTGDRRDAHPKPLSYQRLLETKSDIDSLPGSEPDSPMQLIYTSGTTGDPKAIVMLHRRYGEAARLMPMLCGYLPTDCLYNGLSLTHANAHMFTLGPALFNGLRCVLSRRFSKSRLWDICRKHGCTSFTLLGGMTTAIYAEPQRAGDADNPVRMVLSSGMPAAIWEAFERRFGVRISEVYGAAEGGVTINRYGTGPVGSIGKPPPTLSFRIVDDEGNECATGEPGELLFKPADGTPYKVEYYQNAEASAAKSWNGWLRMGDIVVADADGWLYFQHRKGSGIRRNGEYITAAYIEKAIAEHPDVDDVYVYGVPASSGVPGEKDVVAAVVPKAPVGFDPQAVFLVCRAALESSHVPTYVQVLDLIPKTASEKPQDRYLVEALTSRPDSVHRERKA